MAEIVPFFATELEHQTVDTLPTDTVLLTDLLNAVPKFNEVAKNNLLVQWRLEDGTLIYHIYKVDRKNLFDRTEAALKALTKDADKNALAVAANIEFEKIPWWPEFGVKLTEALTEYFKGSAGRMNYYQEVDSWSVSLEAGPLWSQAFIEKFADHLGAKLGIVKEN